MDKYHIYEEIGKGEFSQVFKGREKKKIEYVAIKRIEKSMMSKVVGEVQIMHKLNSVHMLKFHDWYETRNNLWLILEYCTGADLEALIKQDGHLPETSVRIFGLDIVAAIKYIHSEGMLHCDIRPTNFLVDEYGILKLSDFKSVRKIPKEALGETPLSARGVPCYMAPELFSPEGVHSYQSDMWSIGVVLYQLRRGSLPFGDDTLLLPQLIENISTVEPVHAPLPLPPAVVAGQEGAHPPVTADLADLLLWLLEKNPTNRGSWESICAHPFWQPHNPKAPAKLPDQPVFDAYARGLERAQSAQLEHSSIAEFGVRLDGSLEAVNSGSGNGAGTTPLKLPQNVDSTPIRVHHHNNSTSNNTNNTSSAKEGATPSTPPNATNSTAASNSITHVTPERHNSGAQQAAYALASKANTRTPSATASTTVNTVHAPRTPPRSTGTIANTDLPHSAFNTNTTATHNNTAVTTNNTTNNTSTTNNNNNTTEGVSSADLEYPVHGLLQHSSDTQVKPIVGNKAIETVDRPPFSGLPFPTYTTDSLLALAPAELEAHLLTVHKCIHRSVLAAQSGAVVNATVKAALVERVNALGYLYSIATSAEVANVVLNSAVLYLLLKTTKTHVQYASSTRTPSSTTMADSMTALAYSSRVLCITVLAVMLRYATVLSPPAIHKRDEHIVVTIVNLLSSASNNTTSRHAASSSGDKIDVRFKRRLVAALGETVFYISAQEDPDGSADSGDRWTLPSQAVDALVDCLREDNDEVVKHYAVKTIENVFAQGGLEFKRRFVSAELCTRLLELSLHSKNEALQCSAGMAAAHIVHVVLTAHHYPPSTASNNTTTTNMNRTRSALNTTLGNTTTTLNDIFTIPSAIKSARFVSKVLEKCGLNGIVDVLKDGPAKLQQAYLNIINLVFSAPIPNTINTTAVDNTTLQSINATLRLTRSFFLKSTILPTLLHLLEQASLSAVRGKTLLSLQLLCTHNTQFLHVLAERRLPTLLLRVLSPILDTNNTAEYSYLIKTALSMVCYMRGSVNTACTALHEQLNTLITNPSVVFNNSSGGDVYNNGAYESPTKGPSSANMLQSARKPGANSPAGDRGDNSVAAHTTLSLAALHSQSAVLCAVAATAAQPALRKLLYGVGSESGSSGGITSVASICALVKLLPQARTALRTLHNAASAAEQGGVLGTVEEGVDVVEHACLVSLETLAQIEFSDLTPGSYLLLTSLLHALLPACLLLLDRESSDARVVVCSVLRRVVPGVLHGCVRWAEVLGSRGNAHEANALLQAALHSLPPLLRRLPALLQAQAPIPQYIVRLLGDVLAVNDFITGSVVQGLIGTGCIEILVPLVRAKGDEGYVCDAQLIVLLRSIFETDEGASRLLQNDLSTALVTTLISNVYNSMNSAVSSSSLVTGAHHGNTAGSMVGQNELVIVLVDLLHIVLLFVLRELSSCEEKDRQHNAAHHTTSNTHYTQAEAHRKQVAPLRAVSPALLLIFTFVSSFLAADSGGGSSNISASSGNSGGSGDVSTHTAYSHLLDSCSRSLGILFDLFPDALATQLLSKQSILLEGGDASSGGGRAVLTPRMVFADILVNPEVELKIRSRLVKIVAGVCRMAAQMELSAKAKDLLLTPPLSTSLLHCTRAAEVAASVRTVRGAGMNIEEINTFVRIAAQTIDMGNRL